MVTLLRFVPGRAPKAHSTDEGRISFIVSHKPWRGANYSQGIKGQKLLLAGFSHHGLPDHDDFSVEEVKRWADGDEPRPFGTRIRSYFEMHSPEAFWNGVAFINILPSSVGESDGQRYAYGTPEQRSAAPGRLVAIMTELLPDKIFVFTRKGFASDLWPSWEVGGGSRYLQVEDAGEVEYGAYDIGQHRVWVYGLPHPQFANTEAMTASVAAILSHRP